MRRKLCLMFLARGGTPERVTLVRQKQCLNRVDFLILSRLRAVVLEPNETSGAT
jgi:hypothetical protein